MRVLLLSRYCRQGASSRMRSLQYLPFLENHGIKVEVNPLYDETYLNNLYENNTRELGNVLRRYLKRAFSLASCRRYDLIWLEQEVFPWFPPVVERFMHRFGIPYVVDFDDAIFHRYDRHDRRLVRCLLGNKIDQIMKDAALVVAGNRYLADRARRSGSRHVQIIPTVVDLNRYGRASKPKAEPFTIGWIGSPSTFDYLRTLAPVLIALMNRYPIRVTVIGATGGAKTGLPFEFHPWTEASEVAMLQSFDVGIMPLPDTPWARGKCGYKLIQSMACGLPVVASKVGANIDIVQHGKNGFLVSSSRQWFKALECLFTQPALHRQMGCSARRTVEEKYHLGITAPRMANCLLALGTQQPGNIKKGDGHRLYP